MRFFTYSLLVVVCLDSLEVTAQSALVDSLKKVALSRPAEDSLKSRLLADVSMEYFRINSDSALKYAQEALRIGLKINNNYSIAVAYNDIAVSHYYKQNATTAMRNYLTASEYANKSQNQRIQISVLENIGILQIEMGRTAEAEKTFKKTLGMHIQNKDSMEIGRTLLHLGSNSYKKKDIPATFDYFQKALDIFKKINQQYGVGMLYHNIGELYLEKNDYANAQKHYQEAIKIQTQIGDNSGLSVSYFGLGSAYLKQKRGKEAVTQFTKAVALAKTTNEPRNLPEYYKGLSEAYKLTNDLQNAYHYLSLYASSNDSLSQASFSKDLAEMNTKYETAQKDQELTEQKAQNFRQQTWLIALVVSILALFVFGYLFYNRYRLRQKAALDAAIIKEQQLGLNAVIEAQEAERKRIAKDLHDGIAQELVALKLGFNVLQNKIEQIAPTEAKTLNELSEQLNESCTEVRNISHVMMPPSLEQHGLVPSLQMLLRNSLEHVGLQAEFEHFNLPERLEEKTELGLYRIAQELLNNILKHAQANKVILQLYQAGNNLIMRIEDNGKSFDFEEAKHKGSMGLLNILSRVSTLGGTYTSERGVEFGTVSTIRVPVV